MSGYPYEGIQFSFALGDGLVLFTDGVTDSSSPNDLLFGLDGLSRALVGDAVATTYRPKAMGERVMKACRGHANGRPQSDDIAIACVGRVDDSGTAGSRVKAGTATVSALKVEMHR